MYLLFDIGGTNLRAAASLDGNGLGEMIIKDTPKNLDEALRLVSEIKEAWIKDGLLDGSVIGLAGVLDGRKTQFLRSPNLPFWENLPLKEKFEEVLKCSVNLENDAALAGLGEATLGSGVGFEIVAYITVGTGVGGVRIVDKQIDVKALGFEPGHQIIFLEKSTDHEFADLEFYVSGSGIRKRYNLPAEDLKDPKAWDEVAEILAVGINNTVVHWSPDAVILGGSLVNFGAIDIEKVKLNLSKFLKIYPTAPELLKGSLGDKAGLLGALSYVKAQHKPLTKW